MLGKKQIEILSMFRDFEQMKYPYNLDKFYDAMMALNDFADKNTEKGEWVSDIRKTYTRAFIKNLPDSYKKVILSETDSDKKAINEFIGVIEKVKVIDQDYFKAIVEEMRKKM